MGFKLGEREQSASKSNRKMWILLLVMIVLLFLAPLKIEVRYSSNHSSLFYLSDFTIWAWTWVYSIVGYGPTGFITSPFFLIIQYVVIDTFFQVIFLLVLIGFQLNLISRKDTRKIGFASLFPGLLILGVNLLLSLTPGASNIIVPISFPIVSIVGLVMLRFHSSKQVTDPSSPP